MQIALYLYFTNDEAVKKLIDVVFSKEHNQDDGWVKSDLEWGRESLVPASAVIPAPLVYVNIVGVETLVVGFLFLFMIGNRHESLRIRVVWGSRLFI